MLRPSAAPRWKMTTRRLLLIPTPLAANAARVRKLGAAAVPATTRAPLRRNIRRVIDIKNSWLRRFCPMASSQRPTPEGQRPTTKDRRPLPSLELRRTQQQPGNHLQVRRVDGIIRLMLANLRTV